MIALKLLEPSNSDWTFEIIREEPGRTVGRFLWTPKEGQVGTYTAIFEADDQKEKTRAEVSIEVVEKNYPPILYPVGNKSGREGRPLSFFVIASDPEKDEVVMRAEGLPKGAYFKFFRSYGGYTVYRFSWLPWKGQAGRYRVTFFATDDNPGNEVSETISIIIHPGRELR